MKSFDSIMGDNDADAERITNLILEMNEKNINFDIRFVSDMEIALILDEIYKIATDLDLQNAINELNKIKMQTELLTFNKKRNDLFNSESTELNIMSVGLGQVVNLSDEIKIAFGWDKIDNEKRYK